MPINWMKIKGNIISLPCGCKGVMDAVTESGKSLGELVTRRAPFCSKLEHRRPVKLKKKPDPKLQARLEFPK